MVCKELAGRLSSQWWAEGSFCLSQPWLLPPSHIGQSVRMTSSFALKPHWVLPGDFELPRTVVSPFLEVTNSSENWINTRSLDPQNKVCKDTTNTLQATFRVFEEFLQTMLWSEVADSHRERGGFCVLFGGLHVTPNVWACHIGTTLDLQLWKKLHLLSVCLIQCHTENGD
jgi:hypothetical protein